MELAQRQVAEQRVGRVAGNMASFFCHVDGVAMQFRLERNVRPAATIATGLWT